ncbi:hypothetical protein [Rhizobium sp.]|uniref:hypothetical protein n=1 Tax=Rhizobium sp. TaxID=391 RepID=UPI00289DF37E
MLEGRPSQNTRFASRAIPSANIPIRVTLLAALPGIAAFDPGEFDKAEHLWLPATPFEDATGQALVSARS